MTSKFEAIVNPSQLEEAGRQRMREQIEAASEQLPLSRFFIENRTLSSGLNLKDYVEVQRFPNAANIYNPSPEKGIDTLLGDVAIGDKKLNTVGELWDRYLESRRNLVQVFSEGNFAQGPRLEDAILIDKMFRYRLLQGNLNIREVRNQETMSQMKYHGGTQSLVSLLHDVSSFSYALPADRETEDFLINVAGTRNGTRRTLNDTHKFLSERQGEGAHHVYDSFRQRIVTYAVPEFEDRFWKQLVEDRGGFKGDDNPEQNRRLLSGIGIPEGIIQIDNNPSLTLHVLQDTLKNSVASSVNSVYSRMKQRGEA